MKWSTALFARIQPKTLGWEKRAEPGDLIDFKPEKCWNCDEQQHKEIVRMIRGRAYLMTHRQEIKDRFVERSVVKSWRAGARFDRIWKERFLRFGLNDPNLLPADIRSYFSFLPGASLWHLYGKNVWGKIERQSFVLVDLDGPTVEQLAGLSEPYWDTNSYDEFNPIDKAEFERRIVEKELDRKNPRELEDIDLEGRYLTYLKEEKERCLYPTDYIKKRRMNIPLESLSANEVVVTHCWDKMKVRHVESSDGLKRIDPRAI